MPAPASTRSSQMSAPPILRAKNTSHNTNNTTTMVQIRLTTNEDLQSRALQWRRCYPEYHDLRYHPYHYGLEACPRAPGETACPSAGIASPSSTERIGSRRGVRTFEG